MQLDTGKELDWPEHPAFEFKNQVREGKKRTYTNAVILVLKPFRKKKVHRRDFEIELKVLHTLKMNSLPPVVYYSEINSHAGGLFSCYDSEGRNYMSCQVGDDYRSILRWVVMMGSRGKGYPPLEHYHTIIMIDRVRIILGQDVMDSVP